MTGVQLERFRGDERFPPFHVFAAAGNTKVDRYGYWTTTVERLVVDCLAVAARTTIAARTATTDAAKAIASTLDETHAGRVLYVEPAITWLPERSSDHRATTAGATSSAPAARWPECGMQAGASRCTTRRARARTRGSQR